MSGHPQPLFPSNPISTSSPESVGTEMRIIFQQGLSAMSSVDWGINRGFFIPFSIDVPIKATKLYTVNGATVAGNLDLGIYTKDGTRLVSTTPTAQSGTNAIQSFDITDTILGPGLYYLAGASSSNTATYWGWSMSESWLNPWGIRFQSGLTSGTLPATATFARAGDNRLPLIGLLHAGRTVI